MADVYENTSKSFKDAFQAGLKLCSVLNLNLGVVECYLVNSKDWKGRSVYAFLCDKHREQRTDVVWVSVDSFN